jgi:Glyoxalase/Bleomycin resistance protein/Dioxygenase superfamily
MGLNPRLALPMKIRGTDFVMFPVSDLARAAKFYREVLGLPQEIYSEEWQWAEFNCGNVILSLKGWAFTLVNLIRSFLFCVYFYRHDPRLLERRLLTRKKVPTQSVAGGCIAGATVLSFATRPVCPRPGR